MKKNNLLRILFTFILCASTGCNSNSNETTPETVFVTFKDFDDSVLYHGKVPYGNVATYVGDIPVRDMTIDTVYTFSGWDKNVDQPLYDNTIFKAKYSEDVRKYVVNFNNYDGTLLQRVNVEYGQTAVYSGSIPIRPTDDEHIEYVFDGWDKYLGDAPIICDTTFVAQFKKIEFVFATFIYEGDEQYNYVHRTPIGTAPDVNMYFPGYEIEEDLIKFVTGFDKDLTEPIYEDTTYNAVWVIKHQYYVTFLNYNGEELYTASVIEGYTAEYHWYTPEKPSYTSGNYSYEYVFCGWDRDLENVTESFSTTALFNEKITYENFEYQNALSTLKSCCDRLDSDGVYKSIIDSYISSGFYNFMTVCYDQSRDVCYLSYRLSSETNNSSMQVNIYFSPTKPGNYDVYYLYSYSKNEPAFSGVTEINSYFDSFSSVTFTSTVNYKNLPIGDCEDLCASMINKLLESASKKSYFNSNLLGFYNY